MAIKLSIINNKEPYFDYVLNVCVKCLYDFGFIIFNKYKIIRVLTVTVKDDHLNLMMLLQKFTKNQQPYHRHLVINSLGYNAVWSFTKVD